MILNAFRAPTVVALPRRFTYETMRTFIGSAIEKRNQSQSSVVVFDFSHLTFIEPAGVVALANTIEHFKVSKVTVKFANCTAATDGNVYLDDSGFFQHYAKRRLFDGSGTRSTTIPLEIFSANAYAGYLYSKLMPWIGRSINSSEKSLETIRACLEEVFHNIDYHAGVKSGCVFAQHFPKKNIVAIAISDFGCGIPLRVRSKVPNANDPECLRLAIQEGFTTKSNVVNRGVGLSLLTRHITEKNRGTVLIHSGSGNLSATPGLRGMNVTSRQSEWAYPGTLVQVSLRTDTLESLENEAAPEEFQW